MVDLQCASTCTAAFDATLVHTFAIAAVFAAAITGGTANAAATLDQAPYGMTQSGQAVDSFTMTNDHGVRVRFLSYGGVITEIDVPDRAGHLDNVALGLRSLRDYETLPGHFGAITGDTPTASAARSSP